MSGSHNIKYVQGEEPSFFYVVSEGQFGVALTSGGKETIIHTYSAGDHANSSFGELALASGRPHAAKVIAKTDGKPLGCRMLSEAVQAFKRLLPHLCGTVPAPQLVYSE